MYIFNKSRNTDSDAQPYENEGDSNTDITKVKNPQNGSEPMYDEIDPEKKFDLHDQIDSKDASVTYVNQAFSATKPPTHVPESGYDQIDPREIDMSSSTYEEMNVENVGYEVVK